MTEYQTAEDYDSCLNQDARNKILILQIKELKRELKMHIANCPYSSIKVKE